MTDELPSLALRGTTLRFAGNPFDMPPQDALLTDTDGLVVIESGRISAVGNYAELAPTFRRKCPSWTTEAV